MARDFSKKFTDSYIHEIKPTDKEQLFSDRDNLYLLVKPTGTKIWRFIYTHPITKKRIKKSFGNYPSIPLAFARDKVRIWCGLLAQGGDSIEEERMQQEEKEKKSVTFKELAMLWCDKRLKKGELKEKSIEKAYRRVELYLFDRFNFSRLLAENINLRFSILYSD